MSMLTKILLTAIIWVNLIDLSGFIEEMEKKLSKWLGINAHIGKPFSCSYCATHWSFLIYLLVTGQWTLVNYAMLLLVCFLTPEINDICVLFKQVIQRILSTFFDMTKR